MPQIGAGSGIDPVDRYPGGAHKPEGIVAKLRQVDCPSSGFLGQMAHEHINLP